ncbi:cytochrome c oxidase accessory protein CcoG [Granulosicoccus antarcticus]|uniref:4Fe-4S ferredoxin-type domain-containing protein n=1 Tax=Granulosicoccus antarcticus IMCC3135 TaxID=1192854 RepID=A0A2Z2P5N8_9GAMM|nr:cytochrome c oxidase accessory protein CcoG [Granulosicoccus antarcticus]ASJ76017.1 hypothetical protein IMCC3135_29840 [Granulosicoccus antarcticus IMCC3135]
MSTSTSPGSKRQEQLLLEVSRKVYMRSVTGLFAKWRWIFVWLTQVLFYGLPWLSWNDRQAVLFDLAARKFHIFGLILYPQDFIYLAALLIISAMSLFLFTAVAGRVWCGFACPQTVYTEIFMWIERKIEGDRARRMKLDASAFSAHKLRLKIAKHGAWIAFALWTGITFVGYFTPIRDMLGQFVTLSLGSWQMFWIVFYGFATYGNAGFLREQVCKYMCPYARFQGVMFDNDTWVITYDPGRGEPRGARSKKSSVEGRGDCVDCSLCVQVCPTGIDIRDGQQYECIGCAACIDACDQVMEKVGSPKGLIRYDTLNGMENGWTRAQLWRRVFRPRILIYSVILLTVTGVLIGHIATRVPVMLDVMRDRGALSREVKNGVIENVYRLNLINSAEFDRTFKVSVTGLPTLHIDTVDTIEVASASNRTIALRVRAEPDAGDAGSNLIMIAVEAVDDSSVVQTSKTSFFLPEMFE